MTNPQRTCEKPLKALASEIREATRIEYTKEAELLERIAALIERTIINHGEGEKP